MHMAKASFDLAAFVAASVVGALVVWGWGFVSLHSPASSVAYLVLLVPLLGLASAIGVGLFVVPAWFLLGNSRLGKPAAFAAVLGLAGLVTGSAIGLWSGLSVSEVLSSNLLPLTWFCAVAVVYSGWSRAA
jgi:hypothetical protein